MAGIPGARQGKSVKNAPTGFPLYFTRRQPRVVTADVWAFFRQTASGLPRRGREAAESFVWQAQEFFEAATHPRMGSRPLLYYYAFQNIAKAVLLIRKVPLPGQPHHGLTDPKKNLKERFRFEGQAVRILEARSDHQHVFAELVRFLGKTIRSPREFKLVTLLGQVPGVHRTFCQVTNEGPYFLPVRRIDLLRAAGQVWTRLVINKRDADAEATLPTIRSRRAFHRVFHQVRAEDGNELWFETHPVAGVTKGVDGAIQRLARNLQQVGVWSILTSNGFRYYLATVPPRDTLPEPSAIYAAMFYLGSITRYRPQDFDKIFDGDYAWLISEFLQTQPVQFLYALAGHLAGVDVVRPFAWIG